ncbi:MAG: 3-phosphoshikimate 1-carboxyvinyltransferase [Ruminococcaceae bacterium]|nr:3-phosphoshikimate 1-carboxyvinyltransferase [Oscillospiraceae bacterium]
MNITVDCSAVSGTLAAIPSKSDAHRALICAALSDTPCFIRLSSSSADIDATAACMSALGAHINRTENGFEITPINKKLDCTLDCGESGSTLRFLMPVAAALGGKTSFIGHGRLPARPIDMICEMLESHGCTVSDTHLPATVSGKLCGGTFRLAGNISSQHISGLLMALPLCGGSEIILQTPLESAGYVDMTLRTMARFGVAARKTDTGFICDAGTYKAPSVYEVEGDWSNAAFPLALAAIGGSVTMTGLLQDSAQGDKAILDVLSSFGASVSCDGTAVTVKKGALHCIELDMSDIPDMLPAAAALAAAADGETRFYNAGRLRIKESDRLSAMYSVLTALGADVTELDDGLIVRGGKQLYGAVVNGFNDHRIVMTACILSKLCASPITIEGKEAVNKSYPSFFEDFERIGGKII